jgi:arachidonate 15-lipoxygenase (second type)/8-lipoxygenase (S-type)
LGSTAHHTINTNELLQVSSSLPFFPPALFSALPDEKGITEADLVKFLPPFTNVLLQFTVGALFARPLLVGTNRTLIHMFDDETMLGLMNSETQAANKAFMSSMETFSSEVGSRSFDSEGLSQGMPFVWKALDPNVAPYSITT